MLDYQHIKKLAADAGFDLCGLTPCGHMAQNEAWLRAWLGKGYQSSLTYMERNVEKRADPRKLVEGARTAVVCAVSYKSRIGEGYPPGHRTKIASYACTADYHTTIKGMLNGMLEHLKAADPGLGGRAFVDTAPLLEKQLAVEAGLGWIGRQSLLVTPRHGTYVLLGELLLTDEADAYDAPFEGSRCGRCRNCIESCPTGAIVAPKDRHGPLHLVPHHRTGAVRRNRPRRLDFRLRPLPELLSPQPEGADARQSGVRSRLRPADDGCRSMDGVGRNGVRSPHGRNAPDPQRSGAHPRQYQNRISAFAPTA